jgi:hypothetical protein
MQCHPSLEVFEKWTPQDYTDHIILLDPATTTKCACGAATNVILHNKISHAFGECVPSVEIPSMVRDISSTLALRASKFHLDVFEPVFRFPSARITRIKLKGKRQREEVHRENEQLERTQGSMAVIKSSARPRHFGPLEDDD